MIQLNGCTLGGNNPSAVSWRDYRVVEWLLTPSKQVLSCFMERLQSWVIVNTESNRSAVSWRDRVEWLLTPSEQSFSSIMERLQSWVIVNTEWAIVQLYHGEITEVERLLTWCQQSVNNSVISPWYSWTIAHLVLTITQLCSISMIQLNDCLLGVNNHSTTL
jgi:DNA-binding HxlR family transcriptional regulator